MKNVINKINLLFISIVMVNSCNETMESNNDNTNQTQLDEWQLIWSDEFDNDILDEEKWNIMLWRPSHVNNELQAYTAEENNIFIENGNLEIQALYQPGFTGTDNSGNVYTADYTSGRLNTAGKSEWTYGRFEIRAKLPDGRGSWPAIWMLGSSISTIGWPACGEIDIMEHVGFDEGNIHASIHTTDHNHILGTQKTAHINVPTVTDSFHVYTLEWTANYMYFMVDNQTLHFVYNDSKGDVDKWPFDQSAYLILNLAVGGDWGGAQGVDNSSFPMSMLVDYVRVYESIEHSSSANVTFQVNMEEQLAHGTGVYISGGTIGSGFPGGVKMEDPEGDKIWSVTLSLPKSSVHTYKFRNGYFPETWSGGWEEVPNACSVDEYNNRQFIVAVADTILSPVCFGRCTDCD